MFNITLPKIAKIATLLIILMRPMSPCPPERQLILQIILRIPVRIRIRTRIPRILLFLFTRILRRLRIAL